MSVQYYQNFGDGKQHKRREHSGYCNSFCTSPSSKVPRTYDSRSVYFHHSKSACMWLHCFWVCVDIIMCPKSQRGFFFFQSVPLYRHIWCGYCSPPVLCIKRRKSDWCCYRERAVTMSPCSIVQNVGEFTKYCKFCWYGAWRLHYANEAIVFKYTNYWVYPDVLSVKNVN